MSDNNDFNVIKKVFIGLFLLDIVGFLIIATTGYGIINASQQVQFTTNINAITTAMQNIATFNSFIGYVASSAFFGIGTILNYFIGFLNVVLNLFNFILNVIKLVYAIIVFLLYLMFTYLPVIMGAFKASLGVVGTIINDAFVFITALVGLWIAWSVFNMLKGIV
jgi:hypothetical protein